MLLGAKFVKAVPLWCRFKPTSPRDADTARALFLKVCYVPAVCEPFGFVPSDCDIKINTTREGWRSFLWRRKRGMLLGARLVLIVLLRYKFKPISPRDADTANTLFLVVYSVPAVCELPWLWA